MSYVVDGGRPGSGSSAVTDPVIKRSTVLVPMIKVPEDWRLMTVPSTVIAGPPAEMVVPAIESADIAGVLVSPPADTGFPVAGSEFKAIGGSEGPSFSVTEAADCCWLMMVPPNV